jgi:predicted protein tyrosine phosphatase
MNPSLVLGALCVVAVVICVVVWRRYFETYHLAAVDPGKLYRDGNRGRRELRNMLRRVRPRTIVSLIDDAERADPAKPEFAAEEAELLAWPEVTLERLPVPLGGWPDPVTIDRFLLIATDPKRQPVVVHCAQGVRRTGMLVSAYQLSVLGFSKQQACDAMLTFRHSQRTVGDVRRFIDVYDPSARQMSETLPVSKE